MKTIRANRYVLLQTVYEDYKARLTAGDLTQSSCSCDNDLAYYLDISPSEVCKPQFIYFFLHTEPSRWLSVRLETRRFPNLFLPHLLVLPTGVLHLTNLSFCPMDNNANKLGS